MWAIAWRNLGRNRGRTLITGSGIALSYGIMLGSLGMGDSVEHVALQAGVKAAGGDVLVHRAGYWEAQANELSFDGSQSLTQAISSISGVRAVVPRVILSGIVSSSRSSAAVQLRGIEPALEDQHRNLTEKISAGTMLGPGDLKHPIVLGKGLVKDLGLELGDRVVFTTTDATGEMTRFLFRLGGILDTGSRSFDDSAAFASIASTQELMQLGSKITQLAVLLDPLVPADEVREKIKAAIGERASELEVLTSQDAFPEVRGAIDGNAQTIKTTIFGIFFVVAFGIANTFLMVVLERVRENGLLAALGLTPGGIARLLLYETAILALASLSIGLTIGLTSHWYLSTYGLDIGAVAGNTEISVGAVTIDMRLKSFLNPTSWAAATFGVLIVMFAAALYPALRAARVDPAVAMRTYE